MDFPIAEVSKHAVNESYIKNGHPRILHKWWARRPLASSRAMLLSLLLPDPCDPRCPPEFKRRAKEVLGEVRQAPTSDADLRKVLLWFIGAFANWDMAGNATYLRVGRGLVRAAQSGDDPPLIVDPFAGGGSIPFEALRLGCDAFGSDLNPVACLILKVMLEDVPRHGPRLAGELRRVGAEIKAAAEDELTDLYPQDPDGATPLVYIWARTVRCEAPSCGAEIPLMRSFWLCKKPKRKYAVRPRVVPTRNGGPPRVDLEVFQPKADGEVRAGTVVRAKATCVCCNRTLPPDRVRAQLSEQQGGGDTVFDSSGGRISGATLAGVGTKKPTERNRVFRSPNASDYQAVWRAQARLDSVLNDWDRSGRDGLCPVPNEPLPLMSGTFNVPLYGIDEWGKLFSARQKILLFTLAKRIRQARIEESLRSLLGCALGTFARVCNGNARLRPDGSAAPAFGMQTLPITWTFPETVPSGGRAENLDRILERIAVVVESFPSVPCGQVTQSDAIKHPLPDDSCEIWFTDPPYYFAVPYADLSDFFYVWLTRASPSSQETPVTQTEADGLAPKDAELCEMAHWDTERYPHKDKEFFEKGMAAAFLEGRRLLSAEGVGSVVFAHKTTEGWEALLSGMVRGGWTLTGSWPIATEPPARLRARNSAALETSIHLVCRPRPEDAPVGDWADVLRELPQRVGDWMERLQGEGIRGADLVFACIGPALEIFSRYRRVETPDGTTIGLPEYLEKVWEVVGRTALENVLGSEEAKARNGLAGALEEDSRLTALFLWTLQATAPAGEGDGKKKPGEAGADETRTVGASGAEEFANRMEQPGASAQLDLLPTAQVSERELATTRGGRRPRRSSSDRAEASTDATTLDRVHTAMLLQAGGRTQALRNLVASERQRGPDFERLANALSALYPRGSEEKRLLDAMLLAAPR